MAVVVLAFFGAVSAGLVAWSWFCPAKDVRTADEKFSDEAW